MSRLGPCWCREIDGCKVPPHLKDDVSSKKWVKTVLELREKITLPSEDLKSLHLLALEVSLHLPNMHLYTEP